MVNFLTFNQFFNNIWKIIVNDEDLNLPNELILLSEF